MFLETERLILRRFREEDFTDFWDYANDSEMSRMMGRDDMSDPENARMTFDWLKDREERGYVILYKENGRVIGDLTVCAPPPHVKEREEVQEKNGVAMSFSISRHYRRCGLMSEAIRAVIRRLFQEGYDYVNLGYFDFNTASETLQKKLGFSYLCSTQICRNGEEITAVDNILWNGQLNP